MNRLLFLILVMIVSFKTSANESVTTALSEYAWDKRQLIVFSPTKDHQQYRQLLRVLSEYREDVEERNLHTWYVLADENVRLENKVRKDINNKHFRNAYGVSDKEFRLLLIGYDQGEKLGQKKVDIDYLFAEIDQMPIRIQEMAEKSTK